MRNQTNQQKILELFCANMPTLQALGDSVRHNIIVILAKHGHLNVTDITALSHLSRPAISHHLRILKDAGIVKMDRIGKQNEYSLSARKSLEQLKELIELVELQCDQE